MIGGTLSLPILFAINNADNGIKSKKIKITVIDKEAIKKAEEAAAAEKKAEEERQQQNE